VTGTEPILVVDFGTTTSAAALVADGRTRLLKEPGTGSWSWPSAVCLSGDILFVGTPAERIKRDDPAAYRSEFKRDLGDANRIPLGEKSFHPKDLLVELLTAFLGPAERMLGKPVRHLVLTVPASYSIHDPRRDVMIGAGEQAGVGDVELLPEPVAAAFAPVEGPPFAPGDVVLVYDFGGGTFDAAAVRIGTDGHDVLGHAALGDCGGRDVDVELRKLVMELGGDELHGLLATADTAGDPAAQVIARRAKMELNDLVRQAKHQLSDAPTASDFFFPTQLRLVIDRTELTARVEPLLRRTIDCCRELVTGCQLKLPDIAAVLLVGGSSRMPIVAEMLNRELGCPVRYTEDPGTAVAQGAAHWAERSAGRVLPPWPLLDGKHQPMRWMLPDNDATVIRWLIQPGEPIQPDQPILLLRSADGALLRLTCGALVGELIDQHAQPTATVVSGQWLATVGPPRAVESAEPVPSSTSIRQHSTSAAAAPQPTNGSLRVKSTKVLRHVGGAHGVAFDCSGDSVVTLGTHQALQVWKVSTGAMQERVQAPMTATFTAVAFHPKLRRIAVGRSDGAIAVHDLAAGHVLWWSGEIRGAVTSVAFDSQGRRLVSASSRTLGATVHEAESGGLLQRPTVGMGVITFDWAGNIMATGGHDRRSLALWAGDPFAETARYALSGEITCVAISPDGQQVACGLSTGSVQLLSVIDGADEGRITMTHPIQDVAYSPVAGLLASYAQNTVQLWNLNSQQAVLDFKHDGAVNALAFAPVGNILASVSADGTVRLTSLQGTIDL
jgi:actin-like ATPase involved in cell morphogenesis